MPAAQIAPATFPASFASGLTSGDQLMCLCQLDFCPGSWSCWLSDSYFTVTATCQGWTLVVRLHFPLRMLREEGLQLMWWKDSRPGSQPVRYAWEVQMILCATYFHYDASHIVSSLLCAVSWPVLMSLHSLMLFFIAVRVDVPSSARLSALSPCKLLMNRFGRQLSKPLSTLRVRLMVHWTSMLPVRADNLQAREEVQLLNCTHWPTIFFVLPLKKPKQIFFLVCSALVTTA